MDDSHDANEYSALLIWFRCLKEPLGIASLVLLGLQNSGSAAFLGTACTFAGLNAVQLLVWISMKHEDGDNALAWNAWYSLQGYSFVASMVQLGLRGREDAAFAFFFSMALSLAGLQIIATGAVLATTMSGRSEYSGRYHLYVALSVVPVYFFVAAFVRLGNSQQGTDAMFIGFLCVSLAMSVALIGCFCCFLVGGAHGSGSMSWPDKVDELEMQVGGGNLLLARFSTGGLLHSTGVK